MHYDAIFISDLHLGASYAQTDKIYNFLRQNTANTLYLLGDVFDDYTDASASWIYTIAIIQTVLLSDHFKKVVYVPGNHDTVARHFFGSYGKLTICPKEIYTTSQGKSYLLVHGDEYDWVKNRMPVLFDFVSFLNHKIRNILLRVVPRSSESKIGGGVNHWLNNILINNNFFTKLKKSLKNTPYNGIICGHFHEACIDLRPDLEYLNCGDWIDSCTAIVETQGEFKLINWR